VYELPLLSVVKLFKSNLYHATGATIPVVVELGNISTLPSNNSFT